MRALILAMVLVKPVLCMAEEPFDLENYIAASMQGLRIQTEAHHNTWGIGEAERWNVDQDSGQIWWTFADGRVATAAVQIIGTYNPQNNSFLWAWDHPSVVPALREHAGLVKAFGQQHGIDKYTMGMVNVTENEAWEFVAVANRLANANGGYRADAGGPLVFMTYGTISLQTKPQQQHR